MKKFFKGIVRNLLGSQKGQTEAGDFWKFSLSAVIAAAIILAFVGVMRQASYILVGRM